MLIVVSAEGSGSHSPRPPSTGGHQISGEVHPGGESDTAHVIADRFVE